MYRYVHARLNDEEEALLSELKQVTGKSATTLVREGLEALAKKKLGQHRTLLSLAGASTGKFSASLKDLSSNKKHLDDYGG